LKRKPAPRPTRSTSAPPVVLSIAGSDNSAGAGIQADLKAITALGGYGLTAVTCVVAEVPGQVYGLRPVPPRLLAQQIRSCFDAFPVAAVKTGMLYSRPLVQIVLEELHRARQTHDFFLVVDPVMVASSGDPLLKPEAIRLITQELLPQATVITPNTDELSLLTKQAISDFPELQSAARALQTSCGTAILAKGGHLAGPSAVDLLITSEAEQTFRAPFVPGAETHGTGCTYSAALATGLACGLSLPSAVQQAKDLITEAIRTAHTWGSTRALRIVPPTSGPKKPRA
jgi:hydroxymethylpyrimidine/phosphomethylpyrimidine kinase